MKMKTVADFDLIDGVEIITRVKISGNALKSHIPYELFHKELIMNKTGNRRRAIQSFFAQEEIDKFPALESDAKRWLSYGPSAIFITLEEFRLWRRICKFIGTVVCKQKI